MQQVKRALLHKSIPLYTESSNLDAMETVSDRIKRLRKHLGLTQEELGRLAGKSKSAVSQWERGGTQPERDSLLALQQAKKVNPLWVAEGRDPMIMSSITENQPPQPTDPGPDFVAVERVNLKVSAGATGFAIEHLNGNGPPIFFRADWLKAEGLRADRLLALRVSGDSMEPSLWDGDLVVINTAATEPKDGVAFVLNYEGEVLIKRLERDAGEWWLTSDNQRYKRKRCDEHALLIGRVIYKQSGRI